MLSRILIIILLSGYISNLYAEDTDPVLVDTSGMAKPKIPNKKNQNFTIPPLKSNKKLGFHTGYVFNMGNVNYSTSVSSSLTNDIHDVLGFGFYRLDNAFKPDKFLSRFVLANTYYCATLPIHIINDITRYQWAVASRIAATGLKPEFWDLGIDSEPSIYHGSNIFGLWTAPFRSWYKDSFSRALSLKRYSPIVLPNKSKLFDLSDKDKYYDETILNDNTALAKNVFIDSNPSVTLDDYEKLMESPFKVDWNIVCLAAGYNDQSDYAKELQQKSYWQDADYMDGATYLRMRGFLPVLGLFVALNKDAYSQKLNSSNLNLELLADAYGSKNIKLSTAKMAALSGLSILLSGSFYKTFRHVNWEYYDKGTINYTAYEWHGIRIPDVVPYFNSDGMSYNVTSGYRISPNLAVPVSIEFPVVGNTAVEGSVGMMLRFPEYLNLDIQANIIMNTKGLGGNAKISITPWGSVGIEAGFDYYNANTLEGKRHIISLKNGSTDYEIFGKISYVY